MSVHNRRTPSLADFVQALLELIYMYPLIVLLSVFGLQADPVFVLFLLLLSTVASICCGSLIRNPWMSGFMSLIAGILITGIGTLLWLQLQHHIALLPILAAGAAGGATAFRGFILSKRNIGVIFIAERLQYIGLMALLVLSLVSMRVAILEIHMGSIYAAGIIGCAAYIWTRHLREMRRATLDPEGKKPQIKRFVQLNRTRLILFLIIVVVLGAFNKLSEGFQYLWNAFTTWFRSLFSGEPPQEIEPFQPLPGGMPMLPPGDAEPKSEPSPIWDWVLNAIVFLSILAVTIFIGYKLWRLFKKARGYFLSKQKSKPKPAIPEKLAFVDITETIEKRPKNDLLRMFRKNRIPTDHDQRVRYYFREFAEKAGKDGEPLPLSLTPNEIEQMFREQKYAENKNIQGKASLLSQLIPLYNKVRYGEGKISREEIRNLDEEWK
ncbi:hypothetical protein M3231_10135 [Neobacillus mesonae]|nr:hypothetical protein [Neobacillus mesonae]